MRIRKIDLYGFKSFPDRTTLVLDDGISCIVGPNGCGKSNLVDAVRWCVGEQSVRSLRGGEMSDVIFAGSADRPPVGYAEVAITFSSEGGEPFPGDYASLTELQVARRLHRSGTSEYLIAQQRVRRRDVVDLFLDTGVGNNLYSIIEQGRIGKIVHASHEERRQLIDEAAGITRYKVKRAEATKRLEATAAQLDRAADVAEEMGKRARTLERQVIKAERFRRVRALLRQEEIALSLARYADLAADRRALRRDLHGLKASLGGVDRELARVRADLQLRRDEAATVEAEVERHRDEVAEADARRRELEGERTWLGREVEGLDARTRQEERRRQELRTEEAQVEERLARGREELDTLRQEAGAHQDRVSAARELTRVAWEERVASDEALQQRQVRLQEARAALERAQEHLEALGAEQRAIPQELAALAGSVTEVEGLRAELQRRGASLAEQSVQAREEAQRSTQQVEAAEAELSERRSEEEARRKEAQQRRQALDHGRTHADRAEQQHQQALAALEAEVDRAVREAETAHQAALAQASRSHRQAVDEATATRDQLAAALEAEVQAELQEARARLEARVEDRRQALDRELDQARSQRERREGQVRDQGIAAVRRARLQEEARLQEHLDDLHARLAQARQSLRDARALSRQGEERLRQVQAQVGTCRAELQGTRERLRARRSPGTAAVAEALGLSTPLDTLSPQEAEALAPLLGERATAPVIHDPRDLHQALQIARKEGPATLLLSQDSHPARQLAAGILAVETAQEALDRLEQAGVVASRDGSVRKDPDGLVRLESGRVIAETARDQARIHELSEHLSSLESGAGALVHQADRQQQAAIEAEAGVERLEAEVEQALAEGREVVARVEAEAREQAQQEQAALQDQLATALAELQDRRRVQLELARSAAEAELQELVDRVEARRRDVLGQAHAQHERAGEEAEVALRAREAEEGQRLEAERARLRAQVTARRGLLDEERERWEAEQRELVAKLRQAEAALEEAQVAREGVEGAVRAARARLSAAEIDLERIKGEVRLVEVDLGVQGERDGQLRARRQQLQDRLLALGEELKGATAHLAEQQVAVRAHEEQRSEAARDLQAREQLWRELDQAARELEQASAGASERVRGLDTLLKTQAQAASQARERLEALAEQLEEILTTRTARVDRQQEVEAELAQVQQAYGEASSALQTQRERIERLRAGQRGAEDRLASQEQRRTELADQVGELETRVTETRAGLDEVRGRMEDRYQVSLPGLLDRIAAQGSVELEPDPRLRETLHVGSVTLEAVEPMRVDSRLLDDEERILALVDRARAHQQRVDRAGELNLTAVEEYKEVSARHRELELQRADLEESVTRIRGAIARMNRLSRQRFRDTFDRVDERFRETYPRLVGGGSARLSLTDDDDLLETGVEILVQPPGKRLQNLHLLSGGEKAMCAIALILALFQVKPAPFCIMDEVDAPLDEGNGARFNALLRELSSISQFILITHSRRTMAWADVLYGVTMPSPGVSRLVSVRLED